MQEKSICLAYFKGEGYSNGFTAHMAGRKSAETASGTASAKSRRAVGHKEKINAKYKKYMI